MFAGICCISEYITLQRGQNIVTSMSQKMLVGDGIDEAFGFTKSRSKLNFISQKQQLIQF